MQQEFVRLWSRVHYYLGVTYCRMRNRDVFPRLPCPIALVKARWRIILFAAYNDSACESSCCYLAVRMSSMCIS